MEGGTNANTKVKTSDALVSEGEMRLQASEFYAVQFSRCMRFDSA